MAPPEPGTARSVRNAVDRIVASAAEPITFDSDLGLVLRAAQAWARSQPWSAGDPLPKDFTPWPSTLHVQEEPATMKDPDAPRPDEVRPTTVSAAFLHALRVFVQELP
jgi:hypothetical protein